ncbi:MAG: MBL fold metallo-hydrolase [Deltaproteobacteria bacterium]|nr:MBL fold metallo-hydrolase [Deltaproteobacteria bacterium]
MTTTPVKITVVVDNQAASRLVPEHGLSLWIEAEAKHILFDTGQGKALVENARQLDIPLKKTDILVLSHGHYDHSGAVAQVLKIAPKVRLFLHPKAVIPRYSIAAVTQARPIGMPEAAQHAIGHLSDSRIVWTAGPVQLSEHIGVTGAIPRTTSFEDVGGPFFLDPRGKREDTLADDQALWINTARGLVICVGCSHAGIVNTLHQVKRLTRSTVIHAVIGGFHLLNASPERLERTLEALKAILPHQLMPCHCTGDGAVQALADAFSDRIVPVRAGMIFEF